MAYPDVYYEMVITKEYELIYQMIHTERVGSK